MISTGFDSKLIVFLHISMGEEATHRMLQKMGQPHIGDAAYL
jgi:hypothetical protein